MTILMQSAEQVFARLWQTYTDKVVDARKIEQSLRVKGDVWHEDHVAFRTLPGEHTGQHILQSIFEALGYSRRDSYHFKDKQLDAFWLEPPGARGAMSTKVAPKIFVSELILTKFSAEFRDIIMNSTNQVLANPVTRIQSLSKSAVIGDRDAAVQLVEECISFLSSGAPWARPTFAEYDLLRQESEYAAWTQVFGFNINHFTVSAHLMKSFSDIRSLNQHITGELAIPMNSIGGLTKGNPELRLEQSSTLAAQVPVPMQDGMRMLPYAFVEFAYRYPESGCKADGIWDSYYQGFVTNNADKIFESTNLR